MYRKMTFLARGFLCGGVAGSAAKASPRPASIPAKATDPNPFALCRNHPRREVGAGTNEPQLERDEEVGIGLVIGAVE